MRIDHLGLVILILLLGITQILINSTTLLYVDCFSLILVILLLNDIFSIRIFMLIAILADIVGHWYLGTHLLSIVIISFATTKFTGFYKTCHGLQQVILIGIFATINYLIIAGIDLITHNSYFSLLDLIIEIIILNPLILWFMTVFVLKLKPGMIREI